ncbi:MAG: hypothetical protein AAGA29_11950 [Planctomycetota bacterium]
MLRLATSAILAAALAPAFAQAGHAALPFSTTILVTPARLAEDVELASNECVETDEEREHFDIHLSNRQIAMQLTLLAEQAERDIVIPEDLSGSSTTLFFGVTLSQALDYLLLPCGACWEDDGETITISMPEEPDEETEEHNTPEADPAEPNEADTPPADPTAELNADRPGELLITVTDLDLAQVFRLLAIYCEMNFVVSGEIEGTMTCHLDEITLAGALNHIADTHGLRWVQNETCIWVMTESQWQERFAPEEQNEEGD